MGTEKGEAGLAGYDRRGFLTRAAGLGVAALGASAATEAAAGDASSGQGFPGLLVREREPKNLEFPFPTLNETVVPTSRFFVRGHFPIPKVDAGAWRLRVEGAVERSLELSLADLQAMPSVTRTVTIECAGNSRAFLLPKPKGVFWELGGVGNAEWTGVPLSAVLEKAGVKDGAVEVVLGGADAGEISEDPKSPGKIHFDRSIPLDKAKRPEVLLVYQMNGKPLTAEHGAPVRAIVGGWYGMASVKWLTNVMVATEPYRGFWQTTEYSYWKRVNGRPTMTPLAEMQVKSAIARPSFHEEIPVGTSYRVHGAAWAGEADITKVEVSDDDGKNWSSATLLGESVPFSWRLWEYEWKTPQQPGSYRLMARATDSLGRTQGEKHDRDKRAYMINHVLPIDVEVRA